MNRPAPVLCGFTCVVGLMITACDGTSPTSDSAEDFPNDSIELIIPNAPGGPSDAVGRVVAECLSEDLGQSVVPRNVEGASHAIGSRELMGSTPDGYTIGVIPHTGLTLGPLLDDTGLTIDDFQPIAALLETPMVFVTTPDSPYQTGEELFSAATAAPGEINVGTPGPTSPKQVILSALATEYGATMEAIPLEGQAGQTTAMLGGNVDVIGVDATPDIMAQIDAGEFVPLAAIGDERIPWLPEVPTLGELGFENATLPNNTYMLFGPADLPDGITAVLEESTKTCLASESVIEKQGERYIPDPFLGAADSRTLLEDALTTYTAIVESS